MSLRPSALSAQPSREVHDVFAMRRDALLERLRAHPDAPAFEAVFRCATHVGDRLQRWDGEEDRQRDWVEVRRQEPQERGSRCPTLCRALDSERSKLRLNTASDAAGTARQVRPGVFVPSKEKYPDDWLAVRPEEEGAYARWFARTQRPVGAQIDAGLAAFRLQEQIERLPASPGDSPLQGCTM